MEFMLSRPERTLRGYEMAKELLLFLTLGAQRAQKRGFHQKSWNSRENP